MPAGPPKYFKGCLEQVFEYWAHSNEPDFDWPEFHYGNTLLQSCYNCDLGTTSESVDVCAVTIPDPADCPPCIDLTTLTSVFNPKNNQYETVFMVKQYTVNGMHEWYTYKVYKVPVYGTDSNGIRKIIGYTYYWNVIIDLTRVEINPNGDKSMIF